MPVSLEDAKMNDREMLAYAQAFRNGVLGGESSHRMCLVLSAPLQAALEVLGVRCALVQRERHYFVSLEDDRVLDPSADQFAAPDEIALPVYLGPAMSRHEGGTRVTEMRWRDFMRETSRLLPGLPADQLGMTVRAVYFVLPTVAEDRRMAVS